MGNPDPTWTDHEIIYLAPRCASCVNVECFDERTWCSDRQDPCCECGMEWIPYLRGKVTFEKKDAAS